MLELARWEDRGDYGCLIQFPSFAKRRNSPERGGGLSGAVSKSGKMIALCPALCVAQSQHLLHLAHISSHCFIILVKGKHGNPKSHSTCSGISSSLVAFFFPVHLQSPSAVPPAVPANTCSVFFIYPASYASPDHNAWPCWVGPSGARDTAYPSFCAFRVWDSPELNPPNPALGGEQPGRGVRGGHQNTRPWL